MAARTEWTSEVLKVVLEVRRVTVPGPIPNQSQVIDEVVMAYQALADDRYVR